MSERRLECGCEIRDSGFEGWWLSKVCRAHESAGVKKHRCFFLSWIPSHEAAARHILAETAAAEAAAQRAQRAKDALVALLEDTNRLLRELLGRGESADA